MSKPKPKTKPVDGDLLARDTADADQRNADLTIIEHRFSIGLRYDYDLYVKLARERIADAGRLMLEIGYILVQIREHELAEQYETALGDIGISRRTAQRMMQAAVKFKGRREALADLGRGKLIELLTEDDDDLDALADGGTIAGLTLDDVDRMSTRELRQHLRDARAELDSAGDVRDRLLADKDKKINALAARLERDDSAAERAQQARIEITTVAGRALQCVDRLHDLLSDAGMMASMAETDDTLPEGAAMAVALALADNVDTVLSAVAALAGDVSETFGSYLLERNETLANAVAVEPDNA